MEPPVIDDDNVKQEKVKAMEMFNRFHRFAKLWPFLQVLALTSCSTAVTGGCLLHIISNYLLNHHVVFLIGNSIIVLLLMLCNQTDPTDSDIYDEFVAAAAGQLLPVLPESDGEKQIVVRAQEAEAIATGGDEAATGGVGERQIVVRAQEAELITTGGDEGAAGVGERQIVVRMQEAEATPPCDDVALAIEKARRLIQRFQRTQSEKLKREISVRRRRPEFRRPETENQHREVSEIETLSNEEFRRRVDAFIDNHWTGKGTKTNEFTEYENYALLKMS